MDKKRFIRSNIAIIILALLIVVFGSYALTGMLIAP